MQWIDVSINLEQLAKEALDQYARSARRYVSTKWFLTREEVDVIDVIVAHARAVQCDLPMLPRRAVLSAVRRWEKLLPCQETRYAVLSALAESGVHKKYPGELPGYVKKIIDALCRAGQNTADKDLLNRSIVSAVCARRSALLEVPEHVQQHFQEHLMDWSKVVEFFTRVPRLPPSICAEWVVECLRQGISLEGTIRRYEGYLEDGVRLVALARRELRLLRLGRLRITAGGGGMRLDQPASFPPEVMTRLSAGLPRTSSPDS